MKKRSFFERLTGSVNIDDEILDDEIESESLAEPKKRGAIHRKDSVFGKGDKGAHEHLGHHTGSTWLDEPSGEGELSIDVFQTPDDVIVRTMIPGVKKDDLDISISRDSITIKGSRKEDRSVSDDNYIMRELYWGAFSRSVRLPHEVDIEHAEATESQGVLTIKLPRVDKDRQAKLRVKSL